jgi:tetratricopeptide (TPR) repeat protein
MKKYLNAKESCELGLQNVNNYTDTQLAKQLREYLTLITSLTEGLPHTASSLLTNQSAATTLATAETEASTPTSDTTPVVTTLPPPSQKKKGSGAKGPIAKGAATRTVTPEQLTLLRDQFIANGSTDEPGKVQRSYLAIARQNLSFATGDEVLDDLIGFGYLLVNSNQFKDAEDLFDVLLQYKYDPLSPPLPGAYLWDRRPDLYAGHIAVGSIRALHGKYHEAIESFTAAIAALPQVSFTLDFSLSWPSSPLSRSQMAGSAEARPKQPWVCTWRPSKTSTTL